MGPREHTGEGLRALGETEFLVARAAVAPVKEIGKLDLVRIRTLCSSETTVRARVQGRASGKALADRAHDEGRVLRKRHQSWDAAPGGRAWRGGWVGEGGLPRAPLTGHAHGRSVCPAPRWSRRAARAGAVSGGVQVALTCLPTRCGPVQCVCRVRHLKSNYDQCDSSQRVCETDEKLPHRKFVPPLLT